MQWKINDFVFNAERQSLKNKDETIQLEPLQAKVLAYFCQHQNEVVSREQLIKEVWPTSVVSDNTVNRIIAKLRKALSDNSQSPRYIATHPRQGYMFIADAQKQLSNSKTWYLPAFGLVIFGLMLLLYSFFDAAVQHEIVSVKPLTRGAEPEYYPAISPDGQLLAYSVLKKQRLSLKLKHLKSGEITPLDGDAIWSGYPAWSADGTKLAYMTNTVDSCRIELITISNGQAHNRKTLHHCPQGNFAKLAFSHDAKTLFYAERQSPDSPYYLHKLDLNTGKNIKLEQPEPLHAGHFHFDLHPKENALLVATPDEQLWMNVYRLNPDDNDYSRLFKLDEYLCCAIWTHSGDSLVMMSESPGYELLEYALDGKSSRTIYSAGQQVMMPARHSNQKDYLFVEAHNNLDIHVQNRQAEESLLVASSTIDTLPAVSPDGKNLAYLSDQSGQANIWLHDFTSAKNKKLTKFEDHSHYLALSWSPDGRYIAALSLNEIKLINADTGNIQSLSLPQRRMKYLSWQDNKTLTFSAKSSQGWQAASYSIETHQECLLKTPHKALVHNSKNASSIWLTQEGKLLLNDSHETIAQTDPLGLTTNRDHIVFVGDVIYYSIFEDEVWKLKKRDVLTESGNTITSSDVPISFDVRGEDIFFSKIKSINADIYTTQMY